ncbi:hotdog family protein [Natronolimnohabitans innermongolicus]|uniref:MaoC domain-containing protein dehydratase n=1 Tax=Natronolimnohabitans innermongolicus JCM 12255 TaxID=1227499 RepID=L9X0R3_9EURY|nr:MaoC/PaaZ C-terminal domain-containing protein [Natronolimnohabitans innermongolicus]ELY55011.1 MaoC domain-containing protein dehydratase [Natronolimnohabitans innermongolicus JCM 12255]
MCRPTVGETHTFARTFTTDEVERFAEVSGDTQDRHTEPDDGQLLVHGLLTATLPTKIGGDLEVLATAMAFEFVRPVYTGDRISCTWIFDAVTERDDRYEVAVNVGCENEAGETVLDGTIEGLIWRESSD